MTYLFLEFMKGNVYIAPMPMELQELRARVVNAVALVEVTLSNKLWDE
jgi:hypothetical protein